MRLQAVQKQRLKMKFSKLAHSVSGREIPAWKKNLIVEVMATDEDGEDAEASSFL